MKKLAIFSDGWRKLFDYAWVQGCKRYIAEKQMDVQIYVFNSFGDFSADEKFNIGEFNIFNLPDLKEFDGLIVDLNNIRDENTYNEITEKIISSSVPAISLVNEISGMYNAGIDDFAAMYHMVEHVIKVHNCRKINFVGGPISNYENRERMRAYKAALLDNGIPYEEERVFYRDYTLSTGELGFVHFKEKGELPEAFICANDNIAVGLCSVAKKAGYVIPEDFIVTGFDNMDKASYYEPRITTVGFERGDIAYKAMELMDKIWNKEAVERNVYMEVTHVFQDSCGCKTEKKTDYGAYVENIIINEDRATQMDSSMMELKRAMLECQSFHEMGSTLPKHLEVLSCDAIYLIMNPEIAECKDYSDASSQGEMVKRVWGYPKDMKVVMAYADGKLLERVPDMQSKLLPSVDVQRSDDVYVFAPIHFREQEVGYLVLKNGQYALGGPLLFEIMNVLLESMETMYHRLLLSALNEELSQLYVLDSLTGLYNRMAYNRYALPMYEKCMAKKESLLVMFVDVDKLKYINDNFGHDSGNVAIKTIAIAASGQLPTGGICIRYGGDEFIILAPNVSKEEAEGILSRIEAHIHKMSQALDLGFTLSASIGYVLATDPEKSLSEYISEADDNMYAVKKLHHQKTQ